MKINYILKKNWIYLIIYLFINILFVLKYSSKIHLNPVFTSSIYLVIISCLILSILLFYDRIEDKFFKKINFLLLTIFCIIIIFSLITIDKYNVRVDRWSAVTYFLDALFKGNYPYGAHTHVSETNYPSPFPFWYYINLPFYLIGDVGIGLLFFLISVYFSINYFFKSPKKTFIFMFLLYISPAYWWEIAVRSDSLSNAFLVFIFLILYNKKEKNIEKNFIFTCILCGIIICTRLTAAIPLALFYFKDYLKLPYIKKIEFPVFIIIIIFILFAPYIFWDTHEWIYFKRNPFMSQTSVGSYWVLIAMIIIGIISSLKNKSIDSFFRINALFMFSFILISQISLMLKFGISGTLFTDSRYDISYFTLALPYVLISLVPSEEKNI